ncbi:YdiL family protein [Yersinia massiliensis]|uniref:YdiL family protein n=1 Tax=Yersinia massiliensis TaxID=419257 RepID=UPI00030C0CAE|nr:YdiL family protein [Yersinia massiliensis]MCB5309079.1 YdiL family protein [Yersinia massiliensis]
MNYLELQALRQLFFMSIEESAQFILGDNIEEIKKVQMWQQWENGEQEIPVAVIETLTSMNEKRRKRINAIIDKINNRIGNNTMRFFPDYEAFHSIYPDGDFLEWKIYQSVAAELYSHDLERLC